MSAAATVAAFVDAYFRLYPHQGSEKGYRPHDDRTPSFAPDDLAAIRAAAEHTRRVLDGLDLARLPVDERIDARLLRHHLAIVTFPFDQLELHRRSPLLYVAAGLDGVEHLETRAAAGEPDLEAALERRLRGLPALLAQARAQVDAPMEPMRGSALEMLESGIAHLGERFARGQAPDAIHDAAEAARFALDAYHEHLDRQPGAPFEAMGPHLYGHLLRHEHLLDPDPAPWHDLAERTLARVDAELGPLMARIRALETPEIPAGFSRRDVLAYYEAEIAAVRRYVEERELVTIPDGRLVLRETPAYLVGLIPGASYLPPPPFSGSRTGHFYVRPVPEDMDQETREDYFERVHHRRFRNLVVHEVWPGHHVQFLHALAHPSPLRRYRDDDVMIEGWALYCEQLLDDEGLWRELPSPRPLQSLRFRAVRVLVDTALHTGALTLQGAADLMASRLGAPPGSPWITAEVARYAAEPTQAMSYLVGQHLVRQLRDDYLARHGETRPVLRQFHDRFLAEGSIPIPLIREKLLGEPAP